MIRTLAILALSSLSVPAFAVPGDPKPVPTPSTSSPTPSSQAPVHTVGTVSKIDTAAKSISITQSGGEPTTYMLGGLVLDESIAVGSKVEIVHAPNSSTATAVTVSK